MLCNGDKFGILPDTYWFELIWCSSDVMKNDVTSNSTPADNKEIPNELRATQEYNLNETNGLQETVEEGEAPQTLSKFTFCFKSKLDFSIRYLETLKTIIV